MEMRKCQGVWYFFSKQFFGTGIGPESCSINLDGRDLIGYLRSSLYSVDNLMVVYHSK